MTPEEIRDHVKDKLGIELEWFEGDKGTGDAWAIVSPDKWIEICQFARDDGELAFNYLRSMTGVDYPDDEKIDLVLHLFSYLKRHAFVLKTRIPREAPSLPSLAQVWPAAIWYERECFDLLGVDFPGNPDLRRIMMPEDWKGHPLRKDYKEEADYHGIPTQRPGYGDDAGEGQ